MTIVQLARIGLEVEEFGALDRIAIAPAEQVLLPIEDARDPVVVDVEEREDRTVGDRGDAAREQGEETLALDPWRDGCAEDRKDRREEVDVLDHGADGAPRGGLPRQLDDQG